VTPADPRPDDELRAGASPQGPADAGAAGTSSDATHAGERPRRRWPFVLLGAFVLLLAAIAAGGAGLLGTQAGLDRVLAALRQAGPVSIEATGARGRLIGPLAIDRLVVDHERVHVVAERLRVDLSLVSLPLVRVDLDYAEIDTVDVRVKPRTQPPTNEPPKFLPGPLRLGVERFALGRLAIHAPGGTTVDIRDIAGALEISRSTIEVADARADGGAWAVSGDATVRSADPLQLAATVNWELRAGERRYAGQAEADGDLDRLAVRATTAQPAGLAYAGTVHLVDAFAFDGRVTLGGFDPASLGAGTALGTVTGALDAKGGVAAFTARGTLHSSGLASGNLGVAFEGGYAERRFAVNELVLTGDDQLRVAASGAVELDGDRPRLRFAGDWAALRWPLQGRPAVELPTGRYSIDGAGPYAYAVTASVRAAAAPPAQVAARGAIDADGLTVASLEAQALRGRITGRAQLSWRDAQPWSADLQGRGLDFGVVRAPLAGRVNLALAANGLGFAPTGHWDARIAGLDGRVRGLPARGRGSAQMRDGQLQVNGLEVLFGSARLEADGVVGPRRSDLEWRLRVDDLGAFLADAAGSIRSRGAIQGVDGRTSVQGTVGARGLRYAGWEVAQVIADVDVDTTDRDDSYVKISALNVDRGDRVADQVRITLDGRATDHRFVVRGTKGDDWLELVTRGSYRAKPVAWTVQLEDFRVHGPPLLSYRLERPSIVHVDDDGALLEATCFVRDVERICAAGTWSATTPWALTLDARDMPLRLLPLALPRGTEYLGAADAEATIRGAPGMPWTAEVGLGLRDAEFRYRSPSGRLETVRLGTGRIEARAAPEAYLVTAGLATVGDTRFTADARIERTDAEFAASALSGSVGLVTSELAWLPLFIPGVDRLTGRLTSEIQLGGTADEPRLRGFLQFAGGEIDVYRTNLLLRDVNARVTLDENRIDLDARAATKGGTATAGGTLEWRDRVPYGRLEFAGENLLVADLPEARVTASPKLTFAVDGRRMDVSGEVRIPSARIQPKDLRGAVLTSGDEIIVGGDAPEEEAGGAFLVSASVRLVLGNDVRIDAYGLKGELGGSLLVTSKPNEVPFGSGELKVESGKYEAYTRELDIDRGRLLFAGQAVSNPGLDIRAQRKIVNTRGGPDVVAGINVRGTLLRPQLSFYSDPPMSQSEIASMIIVGRTLDDIQDSTLGQAGSADTRTALTAQGSALLAGQLGRYVGIDDVAVEQGANNATSVVIGKFLSPRLYVSYGVSLTETINTLKLRYTVGDRWVIRTESGVRQSADIEYTIER
jgi:translocation and assembly module TamB